MKFIGQYIQSLIARFRNDVYLEDISTGTIASGGNLGLDSNNKIVKATESSGGISHDGSTANGVLTYKDADEATVESNLTFDGATLTLTGDLTVNGDTITFESANADDPRFIIKNTTNDNQAARLQFYKNRTDAAADSDRVAELDFIGEDAAGSTQQYGKIIIQAVETGDGVETGKIRLQAAEYDGTLTDGLILTGQDQNGEIDVTLGAGAASTTRISGTLTMGSTAAMTNAGLLSVANQSNITGLGTVTSGEWRGTAIASTYLDSDTAHLGVAQTFTATKTFGTDVSLQFRDANAYINSPSANDLKIVATDMTLDAAGSMYLDAGAANKVVFQEAGTTIADFSAHHAATYLQMYENEGASADDYFLIGVAANGATSISTVDAAGTDANLDFAVDGTFSVASTGIDIATDGTITNATWNGTAIAHAYIGNDAIDGDNIADNAINSEHYVDGSIDTAHIADAQITVAKLHADAIQTSSETYADNDTSLMTSKAIDERINRPTQFIHIQFSSFRDDIGTAEHWVPMHGINEKTTWTNEEVATIAPYDGKLLELHYRTSKNTSASSNQATWKLYKIDKASIINTSNEVELDSQTVTGPTNAASGAGNVVKVTFDSDAAFSAGDLLAISVDHSVDTTDTNTKFYITTIWEYNISSISQ